MKHDTFMGGRCFCHECAPPPTVSEAQALDSGEDRRARDEQLVGWLRLSPARAEAFVEYGAAWDLEAKARRIRRATEDIILSQLDHDLAAFWREHEAPVRREVGGTIAPPRITPPRIYAPRAA